MTATHNTANAPIFHGRHKVHVRDVPDNIELCWIDCQLCEQKGCFDCEQWGGWWAVPEDEVPPPKVRAE